MSLSPSRLDLSLHSSEVLHSRIQQYSDRLRRDFAESSTLSPRSVESLSPTALNGLKQVHSRLRFANDEKEKEVEGLREAWAALCLGNEVAAPDAEKVALAKARSISPRGDVPTARSGADGGITRLKAEFAAMEQRIEQERQSTEELQSMILKIKENNVSRIQRIVKTRIEQLKHARSRLLKDAPAIKTLQAESMNDLTHSIYTLRKTKEEGVKQGEKLTNLVKSQQHVLSKYSIENSSLLDSLARRDIQRHERSRNRQLTLQSLEHIVHERTQFHRDCQERKSSLGTVLSELRNLQRYVALRFAGEITTVDSAAASRVTTAFHGLLMQHESLKSRYETLTESENLLVLKLKTLMKELEALQQTVSDPGMLEPPSEEAPTLSFLREKVASLHRNDTGEDDIRKTETSTIYLFLFFLEAKHRLFTILSYLQTHLPEEDLQVLLRDTQPATEVVFTSEASALSLQDSKTANTLTILYNEILPLRLHCSVQQLQSALKSEESEQQVAQKFAGLLSEAQEDIRRKFGGMLGEMQSFFDALKARSEETMSVISSTPLTPAQAASFAQCQRDLNLTHDQLLLGRQDSSHLSKLVVDILEYKLRQITKQRKLSDFKLRADFQSYVNIAKWGMEKEGKGQKSGSPTSSEGTQSPPADRSFRHLMLRGAFDSSKSHSKPARWTFSPQRYEHELRLQVSLTDAKIKKVKDLSKRYTERRTSGIGDLRLPPLGERTAE